MRSDRSARHFVAVGITLAIASLAAPASRAQSVFAESWELPPISDGASTSTLPAGWHGFGGSPTIQHPTGTVEFNQTNPLAAPASGSQILALSGVNVGIDSVTGELIQSGSIYTLSGAIGAKKTGSSTSWSLQLWADTNANGLFDGSSGDTFIGQQFGTSGTAVNPSPGNWTLNSFTSAPLTAPTLVGKHLIVFLNNFGTGATYYDSISVTASATPEPGSLALLGASALTGFGLLRRRKEELFRKRNHFWAK